MRLDRVRTICGYGAITCGHCISNSAADWAKLFFSLYFNAYCSTVLGFIVVFTIETVKDLDLNYSNQKWLRFSPIEIEKFEKIKYRPIFDYGGWGIRIGIHGKAYNVSGNMGIRLTLSNGKPRFRNRFLRTLFEYDFY